VLTAACPSNVGEGIVDNRARNGNGLPAGDDGTIGYWLNRTIRTSDYLPGGPRCWRLGGGVWRSEAECVGPGHDDYEAALAAAGYGLTGTWGGEFAKVQARLYERPGDDYLLAVVLCDTMHHLHVGSPVELLQALALVLPLVEADARLEAGEERRAERRRTR
jgi:hypothetical protein